MEGLQSYGASDSESDQEVNAFQPTPSTSTVNAAPDVAHPARSLSSTTHTDPSVGALLQHSSRHGIPAGQLQSRWQAAAAPSRMVAKRAAPETSGSRHATATKVAKSSSTSRPSPTTKGAMLPPQLRGRSNVVTEDLERMGLRKSKASD